MPQQRNQLEILFAEAVKTLPNGLEWKLVYEPSYHFELQATEHLWGIIKNHIARKPRYNLKEVIKALHAALEEKCTPALCKSLVDECRRFEQVFYQADLPVFGPGGSNEIHTCGSACCAHAPFLARAGPRGERARADELRKCGGDCGFYFHKQCALSGGGGLWEQDSKTCLCGCSAGPGSGESEDDTVEEEEDEDEIEDLTNPVYEQRRKEQIEKEITGFQQMLQRQLEGRDDVIKKAAQGRSGGDSKNLRS